MRSTTDRHLVPALLLLIACGVPDGPAPRAVQHHVAHFEVVPPRGNMSVGETLTVRIRAYQSSGELADPRLVVTRPSLAWLARTALADTTIHWSARFALLESGSASDAVIFEWSITVFAQAPGDGQYIIQWGYSSCERNDETSPCVAHRWHNTLPPSGPYAIRATL